MNQNDLNPEIINAVTTAFCEGLRQLITSVHGIMPDDIIVLNVITALGVARNDHGFTQEQTRKEIELAIDWWENPTFGGKT